jgi:hypothetical protein
LQRLAQVKVILLGRQRDTKDSVFGADFDTGMTLRAHIHIQGMQLFQLSLDRIRRTSFDTDPAAVAQFF